MADSSSFTQTAGPIDAAPITDRRDATPNELSGGIVQGPESYAPAEGRQPPSFLIVGTARSGTTLVQRLACSLAGVRVPPETHFRNFARKLLQRRSFPLDEAALRTELKDFLGRKAAEGLTLDVDAVVEDLGGTCEDLWVLFGALVRELSGPAEIYGEKTPDHLRWWRPMTTHFPQLGLIAVVREPRAVVASNLDVPFGPSSHYLLAERWRLDQREVLEAQRSLGGGRCLILRYEDVVAEPERARGRIAGFIGASPERAGDVDASSLHMTWEWWKERASQPITTDRVEAWRATMARAVARDVLSVTGRQMKNFGYRDAPGRAAAALHRVTFPPREQRRRRLLRRSYERERRWSRTL